MFNLELPIIVETDVLDYAISTCINQLGGDRKLQLVAFFSRKMSVAELNYEIYNKELLAIVEAFKE